MPKRTVLTWEQQKVCCKLTFRDARDNFHIGFKKWKAIREAEGFLPFHDSRNADRHRELEAEVLESVRTLPHINTAERAKRLGVSVATAQGILAERKLTKLNARLEFAGYKVEPHRSLQVARLRRIVATYPGALTHIDFKTFGFLRGTRGDKAKRLGGFVVVDSLTAYAHVHLAPTPTAEEAAEALLTYVHRVPFTPQGLLLSDNALCFLAEEFIERAKALCFIQRTIRAAHPWSNGKVEALNRTLKYQCFPAIAGNISDWATAVDLVNIWLDYYNKTRSHSGHVNKGLPPEAFYSLYQATEGDHVTKLVNLGIIKLDAEWSVRMMGSTSDDLEERKRELPFALIMERKAEGGFAIDFADKTPGSTEPVSPENAPVFHPAK